MMRKCLFMMVSFLFFIGVIFALGAASKQGTPARADIATPAQGNRVIAYYFHGTFRCPTCYNMEKYSKELGIETFRTPFGWCKQFTISIKGHPLAEQSRQFLKESRKNMGVRPQQAKVY